VIDEVLDRWLMREIGAPTRDAAPKSLDWWAAVEAVWPLGDLFSPRLEIIRSIKYRARSEPAADKALEDFAFGVGECWESTPSGAWRVLLERHQQFIQLALANKAAGLWLMAPALLPRDRLLPFLALAFLRGMTLPFPVADRSRFEPPPEMPDPPPTRH